jgi:hypothetical protein
MKPTNVLNEFKILKNSDKEGLQISVIKNGIVGRLFGRIIKIRG